MVNGCACRRMLDLMCYISDVTLLLSCISLLRLAPTMFYIFYCIIQVTKKVSERKQVHAVMEPSKTSQTRWERHHNTFTPSLHLVPFCLVLVVCIGSGLGSAGCVVHVDVHGE